MKKQKKNLKKWLILNTGVFLPLGAHAQWIDSGWIQSSSPAVSFAVDTSFGSFIATAPLKSPLSAVTFNSTENTTSNPELLWVPAWGALRLGLFSSAPSTSNMGEYSVAMGYHSTASGAYSVALGNGSSASNSNSVALADGNASGSYAVAFAHGSASGSYAVAFNLFANAEASNSVAMGYFATASGSSSVAIGFAPYAYANYSLATNSSTYAAGECSTAMGYSTSVSSYAAVAIGRYNVDKTETLGTPSATSWASTDPAFEIGNGTSSTPSDALVVYKDGSAQFAGAVKVPQSGDIPMFTGY